VTPIAEGSIGAYGKQRRKRVLEIKAHGDSMHEPKLIHE
jgi:hypothetical protein